LYLRYDPPLVKSDCIAVGVVAGASTVGFDWVGVGVDGIQQSTPSRKIAIRNIIKADRAIFQSVYDTM